jgi:hypothetical protein
MTNSEKNGVWSTIKNKLAIASLVLPLIALLVVIPLLLISILYGKPGIFTFLWMDWQFRAIIFSIIYIFLASILAIIIGFISLVGTKKGDRTRRFSGLGIALGFLDLFLFFFLFITTYSD